ncbi:MAG TPA: hypothetical protein VLB44_05945 [Kofleriaceae bacterium]|nr:hypothetical protein [Kofleriaceae bacterium]
MVRNTWKLVAAALMAAGAIAAAAPRVDETPTAVPGTLETRPASPEVVCSDAKVGETFGGNPNGCREYLDACLGELTDAQRAQWRRSVDACIADPNTALYSCYAQVPWC